MLNDYRDRVEDVKSYSGQKKYDAANDIFSDMAGDALEGIVGFFAKLHRKRWAKKTEKMLIESGDKKALEEFRAMYGTFIT